MTAQFVRRALDTRFNVTDNASMANRLSTEKRALILRALVEGGSVRGTARIAGVSKNTVTKLLLDAGRVCAEYLDGKLRNLPCKRIQVDEAWAFIYA